MSKRIFFIAGMHRSGTSILAQALGLMGLELPKSIQSGAPDNPKGHFESFSIAQYHDRLLSDLNLSWDTFISPPESWFSSEYAEKSILDLSRIIQSEFTGSGPVVLKDPRLSLFMPLWKNVANKLNLQDFYIIPLRHPLEVAASLENRNKIGKARSFLIWLNYLYNAEKYTRSRKRTFVHFPKWPQNFELTIDKIESDLGTGFPKKNIKNLTQAKKEFEKSLIHYEKTQSDIAHNDIESLCFEAFLTFLKLTKDPNDTEVLNKLDRLKKQFEKISAVYAEVFFELELKKESEIEQQLAISRSEVEQSVSQVASLQEQLSIAEGRNSEIEQQLASSRSEAEQSASQAASLQEQLSIAEGRNSEIEQQLASSRSEAEQSASQAASLQEQVSIAEGRNSEIEQQLASSRNEAEQSASQAASLQEQVSIAEGRNSEIEQQLASSRNEAEQSASQAASLQEQVSIAEGRNSEIEQLLAASRSEVEEVVARAESLQCHQSILQSEVNEMKVQNLSLAKEYEQLLEVYNREQLTVIKPMYRNLYKKTGLLLRNILPSVWVEAIKKIAPNPNGVPKHLTYQPQISKFNIAYSDQFAPPTLDSNPDVFVLSIINWDFRYQRPQHIAKGMSEIGSRVFYMEMELTDKGSQLIKVADNLYRAKLSSQNIGHIQPYTGQPNPEKVRAWIAAFYDLCNTVKATSFKHIIIQHPFWWQMARHLSPEFQIIFDCMDDISGFSNTEQFLLDLEYDMLQKCDKLVVSSQYLLDKYKHFQTPILIRNAAEFTHFDKKTKQKSTPSFLKQCAFEKGAHNTIKVGYVGAIAEWFDAEIIKGAALNESGFEFHLCGAVTTNEAAQLDQLDNINMYGEISYSDVPNFLNEMDVLIIPFKLFPIIQACDPVKFYEYSAMGKPTVTTALPELARASKLTFVASTSTEFAVQIHKAYKAGKKRNFRRQLQEYAANNTWKHRIAQFEKILSNAPKVSIVILSYGDPELTKAALHSLYDGGPTYPNMEVLIVDNGSSASALDEIKLFAKHHANLKMIENGENLGFAKGNNVGLVAATGEYVMLLNNDTVVTPGAIYAMVRHLIYNPAIGVVGPLTNNIGNEAKLFVDYEDMEQMRDVARQATTGYRGMFEPINVTAYFTVMFRRSDLNIFGLLSEEYGRGMFEDDDHCAMIKSKGYTCALAEDAYVHHHLSATFSKLKDGEKKTLFEQNKKTFEKKWGIWQAHEYREKRPKSSLENGGCK